MCAECWGNRAPCLPQAPQVLCLELFFESEVFLYPCSRTHELLPHGLVSIQLGLSSCILPSDGEKAGDGIRVNSIAVSRCQVWEEQNTVVTTCQNFPCDNQTRHGHTRFPAHLEWIPSVVRRCASLLQAREVPDLGKESKPFNLIRKNDSQLRGPLLQLWVT